MTLPWIASTAAALTETLGLGQTQAVLYHQPDVLAVLYHCGPVASSDSSEMVRPCPHEFTQHNSCAVQPRGY
jgi:hypothetical protein